MIFSSVPAHVPSIDCLNDGLLLSQSVSDPTYPGKPRNVGDISVLYDALKVQVHMWVGYRVIWMYAIFHVGIESRSLIDLNTVLLWLAYTYNDGQFVWYGKNSYGCLIPWPISFFGTWQVQLLSAVSTSLLL